MEKRICVICGKEFEVPASRVRQGAGKNCSRVCASIWQSKITRGRPLSEEHKRKIALAHTGKKNGPISDAHREKLRKAQKGRLAGVKHHNWKGGRSHEHGYLMIHMPQHPRATQGYVRNAHLVMERHLGRLLRPKEIVHHIDSNRANDCLPNLRLYATHAEHIRDHRLEELAKGIRNLP